jgi:SAM-dependent MidA family methyltransferase
MRAHGPVTFAEFMDVALYWPDGGYYTTDHPRWGGGGDYITSIDVSPAFSRTIAKEISRMWEGLGRPGSFVLVEAGAGRGWLTKGIIAALEDLSPGLYEVIRGRLIEVNPHLKEEAGPKVSWHRDLLEVGRIPNGCILSNELIDSFPVHRVVFEGGELKEVYTGLEGSKFIDVTGPPSSKELGAYFDALDIKLCQGQTAEVNLKAGEWVRVAAGALGAGYVVTIDYGLPARELYSPDRAGTLLCHHRHRINDDPYSCVGSQDITTHVDFTNLVKAGRGAGLELTGFTTQKNFLIGAGILEDLLDTSGTSPGEGGVEGVRENRALSELIMPGGMGDTFKVLVQHKGVEKQVLKGFSFKDLSSYL